MENIFDFYLLTIPSNPVVKNNSFKKENYTNFGIDYRLILIIKMK